LACADGGGAVQSAGGFYRITAHAPTLPLRPACGYNRAMSSAGPNDVENIPADLDRFLSTFFDRRSWSSAISYDADENRLYLEVRVASRKLSQDDRFLSLVEYFARAQDALLRRTSGMPLQCRLYAADGSEVTAALHARASSYLDDSARGNGMRRRLAWLGFRRRFVGRILPGAFLWAAALVIVVEVVGVSPEVALLVALAAVGVQAAAVRLLRPRRR
jgi:hypothetical protein